MWFCYTHPSKWAKHLLGIVLVLALLTPVRVQAEDTPGDGGVVSPQAEEIVGGQPATPGEWPWQALLKINGSFA
ncbi:MAG TPA: hypothetical protein VNK95_06915 [Caldilineaceae bacterium]|nr:hypothetical protein [Caldilineaceae bacterium]